MLWGTRAGQLVLGLVYTHHASPPARAKRPPPQSMMPGGLQPASAKGSNERSTMRTGGG